MLREIWTLLLHPQMQAALVAGWSFGWQLSKRLPF